MPKALNLTLFEEKIKPYKNQIRLRKALSEHIIQSKGHWVIQIFTYLRHDALIPRRGAWTSSHCMDPHTWFLRMTLYVSDYIHHAIDFLVALSDGTLLSVSTAYFAVFPESDEVVSTFLPLETNAGWHLLSGILVRKPPLLSSEEDIRIAAEWEWHFRITLTSL